MIQNTNNIVIIVITAVNSNKYLTCFVTTQLSTAPLSKLAASLRKQQRKCDKSDESQTLYGFVGMTAQTNH